MKSLIRNILINLVSFWLIEKIFSAVDYRQEPKILFLASFVLTMINLLLKPLLNLVFLPLNFLTFGLSHWLVNLLVLFLIAIFVPGFSLKVFNFPGLNYSGFSIPAINFGLLGSFLLVCFLLKLIPDIISWLFGN